MVRVEVLPVTLAVIMLLSVKLLPINKVNLKRKVPAAGKQLDNKSELHLIEAAFNSFDSRLI